MPNIGIVLREEITRLSRKESRSQVDPTKKASVQHRKDNAELEHHLAQLNKQVALLSHRVLGAARASAVATKGRARFTARGLHAQRSRLGLSLYLPRTLESSWKSAPSRYTTVSGKGPGGDQFSKVAAIRGIGKRDAAEGLRQMIGRK